MAQPSTTSREQAGDSSSTATVTPSASTQQPLAQTSTTTPSSTISRFFQRTQSITLNYASDMDEDSEVVTTNSSFNRSIMEEIPLAQQPHLLEPFLKKEEQAATIASRRRQSSCYKLPLSYSRSGIARLYVCIHMCAVCVRVCIGCVGVCVQVCGCVYIHAQMTHAHTHSHMAHTISTFACTHALGICN